MHIQPIAFGVSFNIDLQPQSHWFLFNGTWQKRPGEPDYWLRVEMEYHFFHLHSQSIMEYHFFHLHSHFFHHFYHWSIIYSNGVSFLSLEYHLVSFLSLEYHFYHWSIISIIGVSFSIISIIGVSFTPNAIGCTWIYVCDMVFRVSMHSENKNMHLRLFFSRYTTNEIRHIYMTKFVIYIYDETRTCIWDLFLQYGGKRFVRD